MFGPRETMLGTGKITARYPSGNVIEMHGELHFMQIAPRSELRALMIMPDIKRVIVIDPRAIVEVDGKNVYQPRLFLRHMQKEMAQWMQENPQWAPT